MKLQKDSGTVLEELQVSLDNLDSHAHLCVILVLFRTHVADGIDMCTSTLRDLFLFAF